MIDCKIAHDELPLRQGDIFIRRCWESREYWDRLGILLTADCDIAQCKFGRYLTYIALIPLSEYVDNIIIPKLLDELLVSVIKEIKSLYMKSRRKVDANVLPPSEAVLNAWILDGQMEDLYELLVLNVNETARFRDLKLVAQKALINKNINNQKELRSTLMHCYKVLKNKNDIQQNEFLRSKVKNCLLNPPGDVFFISTIPGLPPEYSGGLGYYALMREIMPIEFNCISLRFSDPFDMTDSAIRIARLEATYKHALAQKFSNLFSRIGSPEEFEKDQKEIIDLACEDLCL